MQGLIRREGLREGCVVSLFCRSLQTQIKMVPLHIRLTYGGFFADWNEQVY
jgi:hypothetical protein